MKQLKSKFGKTLGLGLATLLVLAFFCGTALASSGEPFTGDQWKNLAFRIGNFVLFVGVIAYFAGGKIKKGLKGRTEGIATELKDLEAAKAVAAAHLAEVEKSIAGLEEERRAILKEYAAQGEALKSDIIARAEKSAEQIIAQAERTAQNEFKQAVEGVRAEMADLVVEAAERLVRQQLDTAGHEKLIDKYLTKVVLH